METLGQISAEIDKHLNGSASRSRFCPDGGAPTTAIA
jgi:hypothetical protein